jgi:hypothetical protein
LQITPDDSYDKSKIAIVPMGFSYRDADAEGDDKPPRPKWDPPFLAGLPNVELTIFIALNTKNVIWKTPEKFRQNPCTMHWNTHQTSCRCRGSVSLDYSTDAAASNASISAPKTQNSG